MTRLQDCRFAVPLVALVMTLTPSAHAADWPAFERGQWEIERVMEGDGAGDQTLKHAECLDPTADQVRQREQLTRAGCQFSELTGSGSTFHYSATCKLGGMTSVSNSTLEVESAQAYTITVDSDTDGMKTHEVMKARRVGDCEQ
jgi:hypothetical protein